MLSSLALFSVVTLLVAQTVASPSIAFPINAQLPPVAFVGERYSFTFSADTFTSQSALSYTITNHPHWLSLDSATRTLTGTPLDLDKGDIQFNLTATAAQASLTAEVVLVVRDRSTVDINQDIFISQLRKAGGFSAPSILLIRPGQPIDLALGPRIFNATAPFIHYYAVSADNTPLPAWLSFDSASVTLRGIAPTLSPEQTQQYYGFKLVASRIVGFAEAVLHLQISITKRILSFSNPSQDFTVAPNTKLQIPSLLDVLQRDGAPVTRSTVKSISTNQPSWLTLDAGDISFSGTTPVDLKQTTFRVTVVDDEGNIAAADVDIKSSASDSSTTKDVYLGTAIVIVGRWFNYSLQDISADASPDTVKDDLGDLSSWLRFVPGNLTLQGQPPATLATGDYNLTFATARQNSNVVNINRLTIQVRRDALTASSVITSLTSSNTARATSLGESTSTGTKDQQSSRRRLLLVLCITLPLLLVVFVSLFLCICLGRRRRRKKGVTADTTAADPSNSRSKPQLPRTDSAIDVGNSTTLGKPYNSIPAGPSPLTPQIDLSWPLKSAPARPRPQSQTGSLETRSSWSQILDTPQTHRRSQVFIGSLDKSGMPGPQEVHPALRPLSRHNRLQSLQLNAGQFKYDESASARPPLESTLNPTGLNKTRSKPGNPGTQAGLLSNTPRTKSMHRHRRTATQRITIPADQQPQRPISPISHDTPNWYRDGLSSDPFSDAIWIDDKRTTSVPRPDHRAIARIVSPDAITIPTKKDRAKKEQQEEEAEQAEKEEKEPTLRYKLDSSEILVSDDSIPHTDHPVAQASDPLTYTSLRSATSLGDSISKVLL